MSRRRHGCSAAFINLLVWVWMWAGALMLLHMLCLCTHQRRRNPPANTGKLNANHLSVWSIEKHRWRSINLFIDWWLSSGATKRKRQHFHLKLLLLSVFHNPSFTQATKTRRALINHQNLKEKSGNQSVACAIKQSHNASVKKTQFLKCPLEDGPFLDFYFEL